MAIDFNQRASGMSKREYAASILGGSKDQYDSSGNKKSTSSSSSKSSSSGGSSYKPKTYDYKNFVDTKPVAGAYDSAKGVFVEQLTALKPRYEELYKQLQASEQLAVEKEAALSAEEQTLQKANLAKRGVATDTSNQFYTTEKGKLVGQQDMRSRETALGFAGSRLDISGAESADTREISTAVANLDLSKATTIASMITDAKKTAASLNSAESEKALQSAQWEKTFAYTKSKDAADKALEMYKLAKSETSSKNNAYNSALSTLVATAYGQNNPAAYTREKIAKQLEAAFPTLKGQVQNDISKFFPDGWESQAGNGIGIKTENDGETYLNY